MSSGTQIGVPVDSGDEGPWLVLGQFLRRIAGTPSVPEPFFLRKLTSRPRAINERAIRQACASAYLGDDRAVARVLGRYKMFLDTSDVGFSTHLLLDGYWEMWTTELVARMVRPGMTCIDVGANLGYFTLLMAELAGPDGRVHAFEPNPPILARLRDTVAINGFADRVRVHDAPLGAKDGAPVRLIVPAGEPKNAHVVPAPPGAQGAILHTRRLDGFSELLDADFVKIDADAAEEAIWAGMSGLFARGRPMTISLEFVAARYADPDAFLDRIASEGFSIARLDLDAGVMPVDRRAILAAPWTGDQMLVLRR